MRWDVCEGRELSRSDMSPNPLGFLDRLRAHGYHPRSNKHSNVLAEMIVQDLVAHCPKIHEKAAAGRIVYDVNFVLRAGTADWNVDLVLGPPEFGVGEPDPGVSILKRSPSTVEVAIEIKSVMTEHRKAIKNRKRDLEAHHEHVHHYSNAAVAAGALVVNASKTFKSPLRPGTTVHRDPLKLVEHCVDEMRAISVRGVREDLGSRHAVLSSWSTTMSVLHTPNISHDSQPWWEIHSTTTPLFRQSARTIPIGFDSGAGVIARWLAAQ